MLHLISSLWSAVTETEETKILFLGTSNSGKSALYERFKIFLTEGPDVPQTAENHHNHNNSSSKTSLSGGLASLKAEIEKRKMLENHNSSNGNDDDGKESTSSVDDIVTIPTTTMTTNHILSNSENLTQQQQKRKFHRYFKPIQPVPALPRFMSPTVGLNVARGNVTIPNSGQKIAATLWDVGGDPSIRQLWYTYIVQCHGVVFTIDLSADAREQVKSVRLLHMLMQRPELAFAPFLIVGTKIDQVIENDKKMFHDTHHKNGSQTKFRRSSIQQTLTGFLRLLHLEQLPAEPTFLGNHDGDGDDETHNDGEDRNDDSKTEVKNDHNSKSAHEEFIPINVDSLLRADAIDAVNSVPSGSVSGICGHMYFTAIANSKSLKNGTDLKQALYWILSAAKSSRARAATLDNWEMKLSEKSEKMVNK